MALLLSRLSMSKRILHHQRWTILSNSFSSSSSSSSSSIKQTPPCSIIGADVFGETMGKLVIANVGDKFSTYLEKKVPLGLVYNIDASVTIGSSHGWVASLKNDGTLHLQDDLNPLASDEDPKRIALPPLVTLPHCQTRIVTNVSMSSPCPTDENCVVAVKFLGPQISFCRLGQSNPEWTNIRIEDPSFYSSRVMFSKKDEMFHMPGHGGNLIGSWDLLNHKTQLNRPFYRNLPKLSETRLEILNSCRTTEHLVESESTGETFMVRWFRKASENVNGVEQMETKDVMVFKIVIKEEVAVYTSTIGDLSIFLSHSEPFCVTSSSFADLKPNRVWIWAHKEMAAFTVCGTCVYSRPVKVAAPYYIPPQNVV